MVLMVGTTEKVAALGAEATSVRTVARPAIMVAITCTKIRMRAPADIVRVAMGTGTPRSSIGGNSENKSSERTTRKGVGSLKARIEPK